MFRSKSNKPTTATATITNRSVKVVLLGESGVGKSSLLCRYLYDTYQPFQEPTIGAAFCARTVTISDDSNNDNTATNTSPNNTQHNIHFKLWDTAGQERYQSLTPLYFRNARAAILIFDISRLHSFVAMQRWMRDVQQATSSSRNNNNNIILMVVGNKSDLADESRSVLEEDARKFAMSQNALYMETSAKNNDCVQELFMSIARQAVIKFEPDVDDSERGEGGGTATHVDLGLTNNDSRRSCC